MGMRPLGPIRPQSESVVYMDSVYQDAISSYFEHGENGGACKFDPN